MTHVSQGEFGLGIVFLPPFPERLIHLFLLMVAMATDRRQIYRLGLSCGPFDTRFQGVVWLRERLLTSVSAEIDTPTLDTEVKSPFLN